MCGTANVILVTLKIWVEVWIRCYHVHNSVLLKVKHPQGYVQASCTISCLLSGMIYVIKDEGWSGISFWSSLEVMTNTSRNLWFQLTLFKWIQTKDLARKSVIGLKHRFENFYRRVKSRLGGVSTIPLPSLAAPLSLPVLCYTCEQWLMSSYGSKKKTR